MILVCATGGASSARAGRGTAARAAAAASAAAPARRVSVSGVCGAGRGCGAALQRMPARLRAGLARAAAGATAGVVRSASIIYICVGARVRRACRRGRWGRPAVAPRGGGATHRPPSCCAEPGEARCAAWCPARCPPARRWRRCRPRPAGVLPCAAPLRPPRPARLAPAPPAPRAASSPAPRRRRPPRPPPRNQPQGAHTPPRKRSAAAAGDARRQPSAPPPAGTTPLRALARRIGASDACTPFPPHLGAATDPEALSPASLATARPAASADVSPV